MSERVTDDEALYLQAVGILQVLDFIERAVMVLADRLHAQEEAGADEKSTLVQMQRLVELFEDEVNGASEGLDHMLAAIQEARQYIRRSL